MCARIADWARKSVRSQSAALLQACKIMIKDCLHKVLTTSMQGRRLEFWTAERPGLEKQAPSALMDDRSHQAFHKRLHMHTGRTEPWEQMQRKPAASKENMTTPPFH